MKNNTELIRHNQLYIALQDTPNGFLLKGFFSREMGKCEEGFFPFVFSVAGTANEALGVDSVIYKNKLGDFRQTSFERNEKGIGLTYHSEEYGCSIECRYEFVPDADALFATLAVTAEREDLDVTDFYAVFPLVSRSGRTGEFELSRRRNKWQGEGQWYCSNLRDLDFVDYCKHPSLNKFTVTNLGSQTTSQYYPSLILSSEKNGEKWFLESEADGSWTMELSQCGEWGGGSILCFLSGCVSERELILNRRLKKGTRLVMPRMLFAMSDGKSSLFRSVYAAKRSSGERSIVEPTVIFNDYMNCLWAKPDYEREKALIDAAAELEADVYVIDDGWFSYAKEVEVGCRLGDWNTDGDLFGKRGLEGLIGYIRAKNLRPGIWIEPEVAGKNSVVFREHSDWLVRSYGKIYGCDCRYFLDFRKAEVREYCRSTIAKLYDLGIRYIKIDYNGSYVAAENGQDGTVEIYRAIRTFYAEVAERFPDLIMENCASGGKRSDNGILKYFDLQSISDQERYYNYPSLICGTLVNILPEKTGVWSCPFPVGFYERDKAEDRLTKPDDEEVIFNLVNGMTGVMFLSSRIDLLSPSQKEFVREAITLHRKNFPLLRRAYPEFPLGLSRIGEKQYALYLTDGSHGLLYLWATGDNYFRLNGVNGKNCRQLFPSERDSEIGQNVIVLKEKRCARIFVFNRPL